MNRYISIADLEYVAEHAKYDTLLWARETIIGTDVINTIFQNEERVLSVTPKEYETIVKLHDLPMMMRHSSGKLALD